MYVPILVFAELGFVMKKFGFVFSLVFLTLLVSVAVVESSCNKGCDLAFASYYVWEGATLSGISLYLNASMSDILSYNTHISNPNGLLANSRVNVPFSCDCIDGAFLGHVFSYKIEANDTYTYIAQTTYANLTTVDWIQKFNSYGLNSLPVGGNLNVTVNCSCGNSSVSIEYGLFNTYPLQSGTSMSYLVRLMNLSASLLQSYNPGVDFNAGTGLVYLPWRDKSGSYRPLTSGRGSSATPGLSPGVLAGICVAALFGLTIFSVFWYLHHIRRKKRKDSLLSDKPAHQLTQDDVIGKSGGVPVTPGITVDKSVEFPYEELANATDNFSMANKIGQGGFGAVYYGELRGEKAAIKKMGMQATKEFLAELKVLTHVHHLNLVRLIGYCVERSLFLVYEYIENGNLSQHLRGSGRAALPWSARVQIALDSARGLDYIHEHTVPVYIHRDIKSANILLDNNFHAKVADFGMTKLAKVGNASIPTGLVGTFGYMPPEYAQFGDASPKVDVYAFGVVLYELISAKEAVVKDESSLHPTSLVTLFEDVLTEPDPSNICKLVDPRLGENYPLDSIFKMAELAKACTSEDPELRPSMRSVVVALNALSSTTPHSEYWLLY